MNKSKVLLVIIGIVVLAAGVVAGLLLVQQNQNLARRAAPSTTMYVTPGSQTKAAGTSFSYSVSIDTGANAVTGVDVRMKFDPNAIQITSLQLGAGIPNLNQTIANTYDNTAGTIQFAVFTLNSSQAVTGSNIEVLKVNATVKSTAAAASYTISFDPATAASASQEGQNVLTSKSPGTLIVTASTTTTATPTPTATSTPTATPTQAPGATDTPTPTATATNTPTPTPTQIASDNSTPTPAQTSMPIPVTGTDWTTYFGVGLGVMTIIGAVLLAI